MLSLNGYVPGFLKARGSPDFLPSAGPGYHLFLQKCQSAPSKNASNEQNSEVKYEDLNLKANGYWQMSN